MEPIAIVVVFFMVLAFLIGTSAYAQKKSARVVTALAAFGWACLMFTAANWVQSLGYNSWYSSAASKMMNAYIAAIEQGHHEAVLAEMRRMTNELKVTYENRGNFQELAERAASNLTTSNVNEARQQTANHHP